MITGTVTGTVKSREARISLKIRGPRGRKREIEAVIDTGYTAFVTLPSDLIAELGLRWRGMDSATLADGSECLFEVFQGAVIWDRRVRRICGTSSRRRCACWDGPAEWLRTEDASPSARQGCHQTTSITATE